MFATPKEIMFNNHRYQCILETGLSISMMNSNFFNLQVHDKQIVGPQSRQHYIKPIVIVKINVQQLLFSSCTFILSFI